MAKRKISALRTVRPEVRGFHEAIRDDPDGDAPRLIFADWLDEFGDSADQAHAQFLRMECPPESPDFSERLTRNMARLDFVREHYQEWFQPLIELKSYLLMIHAAERGLFRLTVDARSLISKKAESVLNSEAILWFDDFRLLKTGADTFVSLVATPLFDRMLHLNLSGREFGLKGMEALTQTTRFSRLRTLDLEECVVEPDALSLLSQSPLVENLRTLNLKQNRLLGAAALKLLSTSTGLRHLRSLNLSHLNLGDGLRYLADAPWVSNLETLVIDQTQTADAGFVPFAESSQLSRLRVLHANDNRFTGQGVTALTQNPSLNHLTHLRIGGSPIGDDGAITLAEWQKGSPLIELSVLLCGVGDRGALALLKSAELNRIGTLILDRTGLSEAVQLQLTERLGKRMKFSIRYP